MVHIKNQGPNALNKINDLKKLADSYDAILSKI